MNRYHILLDLRGERNAFEALTEYTKARAATVMVEQHVTYRASGRSNARLAAIAVRDLSARHQEPPQT